MWTNIKVFTELVIILFLFYVLVFWPQGMQDLSSLTRGRTLTPCIRSWSLNHWNSRTVPGRTLWIRSSVVYPSAISPPHPLWVSDPSMYLQKCCEWGNKPKVQASLRQAQTLPILDRRTGDPKGMSWAQGTRSAVSPARNQEEVLSVAHGIVKRGEGQLVHQG